MPEYISQGGVWKAKEEPKIEPKAEPKAPDIVVPVAKVEVKEVKEVKEPVTKSKPKRGRPKGR